ncbi:MAG: YybH family protein [Sulfuricaulis sp.]
MAMNETRFYTPQEAETAFYAAFIKRDVNAMMAVWAGDDNISCIHPLGAILKGREAIRDAWEAMFRNAPEMHFMINERSRTQNVELAVHIVEEHIRIKNEPPGAPVFATNIYRLTEVGWRMVLHHASPSPPPPKPERLTLH